jgi:hypothetical protein
MTTPRGILVGQVRSISASAASRAFAAAPPVYPIASTACHSSPYRVAGRVSTSPWSCRRSSPLLLPARAWMASTASGAARGTGARRIDAAAASWPDELEPHRARFVEFLKTRRAYALDIAANIATFLGAP